VLLWLVLLWLVLLWLVLLQWLWLLLLLLLLCPMLWFLSERPFNVRQNNMRCGCFLGSSGGFGFHRGFRFNALCFRVLVLGECSFKGRESGGLSGFRQCFLFGDGGSSGGGRGRGRGGGGGSGGGGESVSFFFFGVDVV